MAKRRLGYGDFVPVTAPNPFARLRYLQAVTRCVPEAVQALVTAATALPTDANLVPFQTWAKRWGFTDRWAQQIARRHAAWWTDQPELIGVWLTVSVASWEPDFPRCPAWNPIAEPEDTFRARVEAYIAEMKAAPGIARTPIKDADDRHFTWLALHHVGRWPLEKIAEQPEAREVLSLSTISEGITSAAALVGLTLRPGRGRKFGRPR